MTGDERRNKSTDKVKGTETGSAPHRRTSIEKHLRKHPLLILPDGSNRDAVYRLGQRFLDLTVEALSGAGRRPPLPVATESSAALPSGKGHHPSSISPLSKRYEPPREGKDAAQLIETIREQVISRALNVSHPGYVGHMDTLASAIGTFSDMLVSALNNNMLCWEMSPVFTEMEARLLSWFTGAIGWPRPWSDTEDAGAGGTIHAGTDSGGDGNSAATAGKATGDHPIPTGFLVSGGSLANLSAILAARNVLCGPDFRERGLGAAPGPPVVFASEEVHYSIDKIVNILGFGSQGLVRIPTDKDLRLRPDALEEAIERTRREGGWPFCAVGIAGTTVSGAVDPLRTIGELARKHGLWYHVDAAYGGSLLVCTKGRCSAARSLLSGIEMADSVTFNPQKWLFVPKVCAGIFFRDSRRVARAVHHAFPYAGPRTERIDDPRRNVGEYTIQGTRRVDILKLWLTLEHFGLEFLSELMEDCLERACRLAQMIERDRRCQLLSPPQLNIVCFRYVPEGWDPNERGEALDELNLGIHARLTADGKGWISIPNHRGRRWLRFVILHPLTSEARLEEILKNVLEAGKALSS